MILDQHHPTPFNQDFHFNMTGTLGDIRSPYPLWPHGRICLGQITSGVTEKFVSGGPVVSLKEWIRQSERRGHDMQKAARFRGVRVVGAWGSSGEGYQGVGGGSFGARTRIEDWAGAEEMGEEELTGAMVDEKGARSEHPYLG
eukprot:192540-Hanusia_phi.AAC.3